MTRRTPVLRFGFVALAVALAMASVALHFVERGSVLASARVDPARGAATDTTVFA